MSKITSFGKDNLPNVRASIEAALAQVEKEFGIKIKVGGIKFTEDSFKADLSAMVGGDDPMMQGVDPKYVQEIKKYRDYSHLFLQKSMIGGVECTIVGAKPRTSLRQVVVRRSSDNSLRIVDMDLVQKNLVKS